MSLLVKLIWFSVICAVLMVLVNVTISAMAPGADQQESGRKLMGPIIVLSIILTAIGANYGWLPGTRKK